MMTSTIVDAGTNRDPTAEVPEDIAVEVHLTADIAIEVHLTAGRDRTRVQEVVLTLVATMNLGDLGPVLDREWCVPLQSTDGSDDWFMWSSSNL